MDFWEMLYEKVLPLMLVLLCATALVIAVAAVIKMFIG